MTASEILVPAIPSPISYLQAAVTSNVFISNLENVEAPNTEYGQVIQNPFPISTHFFMNVWMIRPVVQRPTQPSETNRQTILEYMRRCAQAWTRVGAQFFHTTKKRMKKQM